MKTILRFSTFLCLLLLVSCTITKRKYTGGYYINWHSKPPQVPSIAKTEPAQSVSDKVAQPNNSSEKKVVTRQH